MAEYSKTSFESLYGTSGTTFADNTTGDISALDVRTFGKDISDSFDGITKLITASGTDTYTGTIASTPAVGTGFKLFVKFTNANTGASTFNLNSAGAVSLRTHDGTALSAGNIAAGSVWLVVYDGGATQWRLMGPIGSGGSISGLTTNYIPKASGATSLSDSIIQESSSKIGIGGTPVSTFDVWGSAYSGFTLGADVGAGTRTNSVSKVGGIVVPHYTTSEEPMGMIWGASTSSDNTVTIGGGEGTLNAATLIAFRTAANNTTVSGTERLRIDNSGNMGLGTTSFGTSAVTVFAIAIGTSPTTSVANVVQIFAKDSSDGSTNATLGLYTEQAVEAIGTFTASHKLKIWINDVEYWIQLDAV